MSAILAIILARNLTGVFSCYSDLDVALPTASVKRGNALLGVSRVLSSQLGSVVVLWGGPAATTLESAYDKVIKLQAEPKKCNREGLPICLQHDS